MEPVTRPAPTKQSIRARLRGALRRRSANPEAAMSLIGHLRELRNRLIKAFVFIALGGALTFWWYGNGLLEFLAEPYCSVPADIRFTVEGQDCTLIVTDVLGGFLLRLKISLIGGIVLSAPFWLYQLWAFITPGLKRNEKRYAVTFVTLSTVLFAAGMVLAYITLFNGLQLLLRLGGGVTPLLTAPDYVGFLVALLVAFGVSFELPLIALMLNTVGVLSYDLMRKSRRWLFFLTLIFAAFITPTQDPFTMVAMAGPMILLFEGAIQVARIKAKRRAKNDPLAALGDLDDDEASPLDASPSELDASPSNFDDRPSSIDPTEPEGNAGT